MRLRKIVRFGSWAMIVGLPLLGLFPLWQAVQWPLQHDGRLDAGEILIAIFSGLLPFVLMTVFAIAVGGACLLIADIHERLQERA